AALPDGQRSAGYARLHPRVNRPPTPRLKASQRKPRPDFVAARLRVQGRVEAEECADPFRLTLELDTLRPREPSRWRDVELHALSTLPSSPQTRDDSVDEEEAHARGPLVAAAAVLRHLFAHGVRNEVLTLAEAHDVHVVLGDESDARVPRRELRVAGENERPVSFHVDLHQLVAERLEQLVRRREREPLADVPRPRRPLPSPH